MTEKQIVGDDGCDVERRRTRTRSAASVGFKQISLNFDDEI